MMTRHTCAFVVIALTLAGCAGSSGPFEPTAFGPDRTYAIVSVHAHRQILGDSPETLTGMFGALASDDAGYLAESNPVLQESAPKIVDEFGRADSYHLMPARQVLSHPAYNAMRSDTQPDRRVVADGYKYFENQARLGQLATDMGVDGVAVVGIRYGFKFDGMNFAGLVASGNTVPEITMDVTFYDRAGRVVWQDDIYFVASDGPPAAHGDSADFDLLHPYLVEAGKRTAESLSVALDRRVGSFTASAR